METRYRFWPWALVNWSRAGVMIAPFLLILAPFLRQGMSLPVFLVFLHLPLYMVHQYEEHAHGAFKAFVNREIGHGKEFINDRAIFWINVGEVWFVDVALIYLTADVRTALGLVAIDLTIVNGLLHTIIALVTRRYNPGLLTSLLLFLPIGGYTWYLFTTVVPLSWGDHVIGVGAALLLHLSLVIPVRLSRGRSITLPGSA